MSGDSKFTPGKLESIGYSGREIQDGELSQSSMLMYHRQTLCIEFQIRIYPVS